MSTRSTCSNAPTAMQSATTTPTRASDAAARRSHASEPTKRVVIAAVALVGAAISARLAAYQLGWTAPPWEPFFGDGSERVLRSAFSRSLPFPDAGAGMLAYLAEIALLSWGGADRYRTKRVAVVGYAAIAVAMALGSVALVFVQIAVVHALCTLCLASAAISIALVFPALVELRATWADWRADRSRFARRTS